jgi:hypothetical protein
LPCYRHMSPYQKRHQHLTADTGAMRAAARRRPGHRPRACGQHRALPPRRRHQDLEPDAAGTPAPARGLRPPPRRLPRPPTDPSHRPIGTATVRFVARSFERGRLHPYQGSAPGLFPRIAPATCANDAPPQTATNRSAPMACGPNVDQTITNTARLRSGAHGAPILRNRVHFLVGELLDGRPFGRIG